MPICEKLESQKKTHPIAGGRILANCEIAARTKLCKSSANWKTSATSKANSVQISLHPPNNATLQNWKKKFNSSTVHNTSSKPWNQLDNYSGHKYGKLMISCVMRAKMSCIVWQRFGKLLGIHKDKRWVRLNALSYHYVQIRKIVHIFGGFGIKSAMGCWQFKNLKL